MFKNIVLYVTISSLIFYSLGCSSRYLTTPDKLPQYPRYRIARVVKLDGTVIEFHNSMKSDAYLRNNNIVGKTKEGIRVEIPISEVKTVYIWKINRGKMKNRMIVLAVGLVLLYFLVPHSPTTDQGQIFSH